jgi:hypothetical protein
VSLFVDMRELTPIEGTNRDCGQSGQTGFVPWLGKAHQGNKVEKGNCYVCWVGTASYCFSYDSL